MHDQCEPKVKSRFAGMLLDILSSKFDDPLRDIESLKRKVREYASQSDNEVPDFILCGLLLHGLTDVSLREHLVLQSARLTTFAELKEELCNVCRSREPVNGGPVPMDVNGMMTKAWQRGKQNQKGNKGKKGKPNDTGKGETPA